MGAKRLTVAPGNAVMELVTGLMETERIPPISVALCIDGDSLERFGRILRHLAVGLVDQAVRTRLVSPDPRIEELALGPIQAVGHPPIHWPVSRRRIEGIIDALTSPSPTVVHAMAHSTYRTALALADHFDADLVLQVTSLADCAALREFDVAQAGRIVAFSDRLAGILENELRIPADRIVRIRPGVQAFDRPCCFGRSDRVPTVLCTAPLEKGWGVDRLLGAAEILRNRGRRAMFFLLGQGSHESSLRRRARDRGVSATVAFAQTGGDSLPVMTSADLFVRPADGGAFHSDGLQALGAGLAVVTVPDSVGEYFRGGETALVYEGRDATSLAEAIEELLLDRPLAQRLASSGLDYVRANHGMSMMAEQTAALYRQLALARSTFSIKE